LVARNCRPTEWPQYSFLGNFVVVFFFFFHRHTMPTASKLKRVQKIAAAPDTLRESWTHEVLYQALHLAKKETPAWTLYHFSRMHSDMVRLRLHGGSGLNTMTFHIRLCKGEGYACVLQPHPHPQSPPQAEKVSPPIASFGQQSMISQASPPSRKDLVWLAKQWLNNLVIPALAWQHQDYDARMTRSVRYYDAHPDELQLCSDDKKNRIDLQKKHLACTARWEQNSSDDLYVDMLHDD
jgi:hypothetical protein